MEAPNVVARFRDGRVAKGYCLNFNAAKPTFYLIDAMDNGKTLEVRLADLKAVFFVKTFKGNPAFSAAREFIGGTPSGRRMRVVFADGEEIIGYSLTYHAEGLGFFLTPNDPRTNNERIFVVNNAAARIEPVNMEKNPLPASTCYEMHGKTG